jgi:hypothetical protein
VPGWPSPVTRKLLELALRPLPAKVDGGLCKESRLKRLALLILVGASMALVYCGSPRDSEDIDMADAGSPDAASPSTDAGELADAGQQDAGPSSEAACSFNSDCPVRERCECTEADGCRCLIGERGTGVSGVDTCVDGNDCESSLCIEGNGGNYYCSGPCATNADCGPTMPLCASISMVGRICIRDPNG